MTELAGWGYRVGAMGLGLVLGLGLGLGLGLALYLYLGWGWGGVATVWTNEMGCMPKIGLYLGYWIRVKPRP